MTLLAAYAFDEASGLTANDSSGNGKHLTGANLTDFQWTTGHTNNGLRRQFLGGAGMEWKRTWSGTAPSTACTVGLWIKLDSTGTGNIFSFISANSEVGFYVASSGAISCYFNASGTANSIVVGTGLSAVWHHIAVSFAGTTATTFLDGVSANSAGFGGNVLNLATSTIKVSESAIAYHDDLRVYDVAMSAGQITTDMNTPVTIASTVTLPALVMAPRWN